MSVSGPRLTRTQRLYRVLLRTYPREYRDEYGAQMERDFTDLVQAVEGSGLALLSLLFREVRGCSSTVWQSVSARARD